LWITFVGSQCKKLFENLSSRTTSSELFKIIFVKPQEMLDVEIEINILDEIDEKF
jgi:hypothetical protein